MEVWLGNLVRERDTCVHRLTESQGFVLFGLSASFAFWCSSGSLWNIIGQDDTCAAAG